MVVFVALALHVVTWATHITGAKTYQQMVMDLLGRVCFVVHTHTCFFQSIDCWSSTLTSSLCNKDKGPQTFNFSDQRQGTSTGLPSAPPCPMPNPSRGTISKKQQDLNYSRTKQKAYAIQDWDIHLRLQTTGIKLPKFDYPQIIFIKYQISALHKVMHLRSWLS